MPLTAAMYLAALVAAIDPPAPAPAAQASPPAAPPTKLQEIGRVRATICTPIVVHANGAISQALDNDRALAILTHNLRATNFDRLDIDHRKAVVGKMVAQAAQVRTTYRGADGEIKHLRTYAEQSTDPERKAELKAFADALGGAIQRQMRAVEEFDKAVAIIQGRDQAFEAATLSANVARPLPANLSNANPYDKSVQVLLPPSMIPTPPPWNDALHAVADDLDTRVGLIQIDEGVAADHSIAATTGC